MDEELRMKTPKKRQNATLFLNVVLVLGIFLPLVSGNLSTMFIPFISTSSDVTSDPVQPLVITDDAQSEFWTITLLGTGDIGVNLTDNPFNKKTGENSLKIVSGNGTCKYFDICHQFEQSQNFYMRDVLVLWWCGNNTNAEFRLNLYTPNETNKIYYDFLDNFSGWKQFILYFDKNFTAVGNVNLSFLKEISISLRTANTKGTWYLDSVIVDIISPITPNEYLEHYVWALNRLLDHRHNTLKMIDANWDAQTNSNSSDDVKFDLTLPTFLEAYRITGNETYLTYAKECFDKGVQYCYNSETKLFATGWNKTTVDYVNRLNLLWAGVLLNSMFDLCGVTKNSTHELYANNYAEGLHTYGISSSNLVHHEIRVSDGSVITHDSSVSMQYGRIIGAYIKGHEVTGIEEYKTWAKDITEAFWSYRDTETNLYPESIDSRGYVPINEDFNMPTIDPIQNVLLYAYEVTRDSYYKTLAKNITDAQIKYAWDSNLNRMINSVWLDGEPKNKNLDMVHGPQLYIVGLLQLYYYTGVSSYVDYAKRFWDTIHENALVNHLYVKNLDINNDPDDVASLYTHHMMAQCDAYMFHFTKDEKYLVDLKNTVNNFLLHFKCKYGTCNQVNVTNYCVTDSGTYDWLDSTSYILGSAIYLYSVYSTQTTTNVDADLTYYLPYYPMLKLAGGLNYSNNRLDFNATGTAPNLDLTFTFPKGKTVDTITVNGSSIFLYVKNTSHMFIHDAGTYSVIVTMMDGAPQDAVVNTFDFANERLTVTLATTSNSNVTVRLRIPFNETSQKPFPYDAWDVNCTEAEWGKCWSSASRILTVWAISDGSATITVFNPPPSGSITIAEWSGYINTGSVTLTLSATDATSGVAKMRFSSDATTWTQWEPYATSKSWTLPIGDGTKTVYVQYMDNAGSISPTYQDTILLDTTKPTANAGNDQTVNEDTLVTFNASAQDENGIASYTWTFIDITLQTLNGKNQTYNFTTPGTYEVALGVRDLAGNYATDIVIISVLDVTNPIANAGSDQTVNVGTTMSLDAGDSTDNVDIISYEWNFGDGTTGNGKTTSHTYTRLGTYTVTLTVKDAAGNSATDSITITVLAAEGLPTWIIGTLFLAITLVAAVAATILWSKRK